MEYVGGPRDGERDPARGAWLIGSIIKLKDEDNPEVEHSYRVDRRANGSKYLMYVGASKVSREPSE